MRRLFTILVLAVFHLAASIYFVTMAFMDTMSRFDAGAARSLGQSITLVMARTLTFPLVWLLDLMPSSRGDDRALTTVIVCANSLLWGVVTYTGFSWLSGRLKARRAGSATSPSEKA